MLEHPGVICYHAYYPSQRVSQWTEIYATDKAFAAHLANDKGKGPLATVIDACDKITCQCWGNGVQADEVIASMQVAMLAGLSYTTLRDAILTHPTMLEGLIPLFSAVPPISQSN